VHRFQDTRDPQWFAELFARYRKKIYFACRAFHNDGIAAEDATQETFLRAYEKIHQFSGGDFGGWLMRIAKNICIDAWRRRMQTEVLDDSETQCVAVTSGYELRLSAEHVLRQMKSLPAEQRQCLEMKIEGYSYEETATRMGLTVEAVKSHLQNGRRRLWLRMAGTPIRSK